MLTELLLGSALAALFTTLGVPSIVLRAVRWRGVLTLLLCAGAGALSAVIAGDPPGWWALGGAVAALPAAALVIGVRSAWTGWARAMFFALVQAALIYLGAATIITLGTARGALGIIVGTVLLVLQALSLTLTLSFAFEILDVLGRRRAPARDAAARAPEPSSWPAVCIQVPTYNEPPELVIATIEQLLDQDYPGSWMVQVVDNNTSDETVWRPVEAFCNRYHERITFMHLADWPGYKAGALNEATRRLPTWIEIVAVVDADYLVAPEFLRATARHFADPDVAFVQTPQHYRDWEDDKYLAGLFYSYRYFFDVAMPSRSEHNAIIFGGTMGLIRRSALAEIGGWDEWCITEDAEASLRLLARGYRGVYEAKSYGAGLMPLSFDGLKRQRFRWCFGGVQILRKHWRLLLTGSAPEGRPTKLTMAQRLAYLLGGLQWFNEVLTFGFTAILLLVAMTAAVGGQLGLPALTGAALVVPPLLIATGLLRTQWALRAASGCTRGQAIRAFLVFFAMSWTVTRACYSGLVRATGTFLRTPKARGARAWQRAVRACMPESLVAATCVSVALMVGVLVRGPVPLVLMSLLVLQATIYGAAPLCGLWAEGIELTPARRVFARSAQNTGERPLRRRAVLKLGVASALATAAVAFIALSAAAPRGGVPLTAPPGFAGPVVGALVGPGSSGAPGATDPPTPDPRTSASKLNTSRATGTGGTPPLRTPGASGAPSATPTGFTTPSAVPSPTAIPGQPTAHATPPASPPTPSSIPTPSPHPTGHV